MRAGFIGIAPLLFALSLAQADEPAIESEQPPKPVSPYIDSLKAKLPAQEDPRGYTEREHEKLPSKPDTGSLIQSVQEKYREEDDKRRQSPRFVDTEREKFESKTSGGAIQAYKEGRSELEAKYRGEIHHAGGVRVGAAMTRAITSAAQTRGFSDIYSAKTFVPDVTFFYEYQPLHSEYVGSLGITASLGVAYYQGYGVLKNNLTNPMTGEVFGTTAQTKFSFFSIPATVGVNYRFNLLRFLRPYAQISAAAIGYAETRADKSAYNRGHSEALILQGGAAILLNWLDRDASWEMYDTYGIRHYYLTVDFTQMMTLVGDVRFAITGISAGLAMEF